MSFTSVCLGKKSLLELCDKMKCTRIQIRASNPSLLHKNLGFYRSSPPRQQNEDYGWRYLTHSFFLVYTDTSFHNILHLYMF